KADQKQKPGEENKQGQKQKGQQSPGKDQGPPRPQTEQEKADQRFRQETGMPRDRAMQLLEALQENEKAEQKKRLAWLRAGKKGTRPWGTASRRKVPSCWSPPASPLPGRGRTACAPRWTLARSASTTRWSSRSPPRAGPRTRWRCLRSRTSGSWAGR